MASITSITTGPQQTNPGVSGRYTSWDLCCPGCKSPLGHEPVTLRCANDNCKLEFPIVGEIPIIINESRSIFRIDEIIAGESFFAKRSPRMQWLKTVFPKSIWQPQSAMNCQRLGELLSTRDRPRVLIVGAGVMGEGMDRLLKIDSIEFIETDVGINGRTALVCDGHDLPFPDGYFDAAVYQAVLEHVVDPFRCVSEAHRVLKRDGFILAETPFMQQVHGGRYDFLRFSDLGHRRLFRSFSETASGAVGGPATALAWAYEAFLVSFCAGPWSKAILKTIARLSSFWLKYFDSLLISRAGSLDAASAYYFLGQKSDCVLSDRELLKMYRGLC